MNVITCITKLVSDYFLLGVSSVLINVIMQIKNINHTDNKCQKHKQKVKQIQLDRTQHYYSTINIILSENVSFHRGYFNFSFYSVKKKKKINKKLVCFKKLKIKIWKNYVYKKRKKEKNENKN